MATKPEDLFTHHIELRGGGGKNEQNKFQLLPLFGCCRRRSVNGRSKSINLHLHPEALHPEHLTIIQDVMTLMATVGDKKDVSGTSS